jgi:hypothetical protein
MSGAEFTEYRRQVLRSDRRIVIGYILNLMVFRLELLNPSEPILPIYTLIARV